MGRYTTAYKIAGTESFRLSSAKLFGKYGGNIQNKPNEIRDMFIADEGKVLVQIDQAGAEALVVAYLTQRGNFRKLFENGIKSHVYVAMHLFSTYWGSSLGIDMQQYLTSPIENLKTLPDFKRLVDAIKKHDTYYYIGKKACHSFNYDKRASSFVTDILFETGAKIRLTKQEAERIYNTYHTLFPEIRQWHVTAISELSKNNLVARNLFGYPRKFTGVWGDNLFRELYAFIPQSTVGTITNKAIRKLHILIESSGNPWGADLLQNGHDSILSQCNDDPAIISDWITKLREAIEIELTNFRGEKFKMKSEVGVGKNWRKYDEELNPDGLREI